MTKLKLPQLSEKMSKGTVVACEIAEGEEFQVGDTLYAVETDKVVSCIEADQAGRLIRWLIEEGDEVAVGTEIAEVEFE